MKVKSSEFKASAPDLKSCPEWALPEFALVGRSNVGKSSLINFLTNRRDLARVSDTPGKTQTINFFVINGNWSLVDLPGYGYAAVAKDRRAEFNEAVAHYLSERSNLQCVFVLIDSRLPPQPIDIEFLQWLEVQDIPFAIILTKTDKKAADKKTATLRTLTEAMGTWRGERSEVLRSSSTARTGQGEILAYIAKRLVGGEPS